MTNTIDIDDHLDRLRAAVEKQDHELAHALEDLIYICALSVIAEADPEAKGYPPDYLQQLARQALQAREIQFEGWYAMTIPDI